VGTGLIPIGGAVDRLPHLMGRGRALEVILGCDDFDAALAERYGWINRAIQGQRRVFRSFSSSAPASTATWS
jgi:enoyl-CoA hydratase/carnithine racemase